MSQVIPHLALDSLSQSQRALFERQVAAFEQQWHHDPSTRIDGFLSDDPVVREFLRVELAEIEAEFLRIGNSDEVSREVLQKDTSRGDVPNADLPSSFNRNNDLKQSSNSRGEDTTGIAFDQRLAEPSEKMFGGLGEVWVVHQPSLDRSIVVKQLQKRWHGHLRAERAFMQEVQITSLLEHPGVTPVHAVGTTKDGRPCYSMRYICGETLEQAITRYHQGLVNSAKTEHCAGELRKLLVHFVDVCNTIAYAHSRGVLHRDLKPSNVMIGPYGQTMVIDWGLAKWFGVPSSPEQPLLNSATSNSASRDPFSATGSAKSKETVIASNPEQPSGSTALDKEFDRLQTAFGDIVGTPAFMSPEQALGQVEKISPATDVFGLGTVLYCILYGEAPYIEGHGGKSLDRAAQRDAVFPATVGNRSIPKPLIAVCTKAMAMAGGDRYADAGALAADVQSWIAGEPVSAMRTPWMERIWRWAKRRRTIASACAVLAFTLLGTGAISYVLVQQERAERRVAEEAARIKDATAAEIADYLSKIFSSIDPIRFDDPGFIAKDSQTADGALRKILDRGQELVHARLSNDPELYLPLLLSMASSYRSLGDYNRAGVLLAQGTDSIDDSLPADSLWRLQLDYQRARLAIDTGDYGSAEQILRGVIRAAMKLNPPRPLLAADAKFHLAWMKFYQPLGTDEPQFNRQSVLESIQLFSEIIETRERLLAPNDRGIGMAYVGLAAAKSCFDEQVLTAGMAAAKAVEVFRMSDQDVRLGSFILEYQEAELLRKKEKYHEALALYQRLGKQIEEFLGKRHPIYGVHLLNMAGHHNKFGYFKEAEETMEEVRQIARQLPAFQSAASLIKGLKVYAEAMVDRQHSRALEVTQEALAYARQRPQTNAAMIEQLEALLARLQAPAALSPP